MRNAKIRGDKGTGDGQVVVKKEKKVKVAYGPWMKK